MRAALIILAEYEPHPGEPCAPALLAGKHLSLRQLDFARVCGAEQIIAFGNGASDEAKLLRHRAESAGLRFSAVTSSHALSAALHDDDELLVLQPGLFAEDQTAADILMGAPAILTLPSAAGADTGFERIDLERAWAGAMVVPGNLLAGLEKIPGDSEPAGALLRIALQGRVVEEPLDEQVLATGQWVRFSADQDMDRASAVWIGRHLSVAPADAPSNRLANALLQRVAPRILAVPAAIPAIMGAAAMLGGASLAAAWLGHAAAAFAIVALLVPLVHLAFGAQRLATAPLGESNLPRWMMWALGRWPDMQLLAAGVLTIDGSWPHRIFAPLILILLLWSSGRQSAVSWRNLLKDRGILAAVIAMAALGGWQEPAIMLLAVVVAGLAAHRRSQRRPERQS